MTLEGGDSSLQNSGSERTIVKAASLGRLNALSLSFICGLVLVLLTGALNALRNKVPSISLGSRHLLFKCLHSGPKYPRPKHFLVFVTAVIDKGSGVAFMTFLKSFHFFHSFFNIVACLKTFYLYLSFVNILQDYFSRRTFSFNYDNGFVLLAVTSTFSGRI